MAGCIRVPRSGQTIGASGVKVWSALRVCMSLRGPPGDYYPGVAVLSAWSSIRSLGVLPRGFSGVTSFCGLEVFGFQLSRFALSRGLWLRGAIEGFQGSWPGPLEAFQVARSTWRVCLFLICVAGLVG